MSESMFPLKFFNLCIYIYIYITVFKIIINKNKIEKLKHVNLN